jgi:hypothetical protein
MGSYIPHTHTQRRPLKRRAVANRTVAAEPSDDSGHRERITREREQQARLEAERRERMAARREQRARDARRADTRKYLEARAEAIFPWNLLTPERKMAAILTGQPLGAMCPIAKLARLFAGVNLGVSPEELGATGELANFVKLSAPRTRSWSRLTQAADFFIAAQAFEGHALDRAALMDKASDALTRLERRLLALPDWLTIHELRGSWFIVRLKRETAKQMWQEVISGKSANAP